MNGVEGREEKQKNTQANNQPPQHNNKKPLNQTNRQNQSTTPGSGEEDRGLNRKFKRGERIRV